MDGNFELLLKGVSQLTAEAEQHINNILVGQYGVSSHELRELREGSRTSLCVMASEHSAALEKASQHLSSLGGEVSIVTNKNKSTKKKQRQDSNSVTDGKASPFKAFYQNYTRHLSRILDELNVEDVERLATLLMEARSKNRQIFVLGNGGSAATASHMVTDLAKPVSNDERHLFRVIGLTDNVSWISASANDYGYHSIFTNQLRNLLQPQDLVIGISSSGNSMNIIDALEFANSKGAVTVGIVGFGGGNVATIAHHSIVIPTEKGDYGYHEDTSLILNHVVSLYIRDLDSQAVQREEC